MRFGSATRAIFEVASFLSTGFNGAKKCDQPRMPTPKEAARDNVLEFNELKPADGHQVDACTLVLGQKNYSSWSMRAWLLLKTLGVPFTHGPLIGSIEPARAASAAGFIRPSALSAPGTQAL
jgi:hypothetical protein